MSNNEWQTILKTKVEGNQGWLFGIESKELQELISQFQLSQGFLYHYTSQIAANGIYDGEAWITQADSFLDENEINHGTNLLLNTADSVFTDKTRLSEFQQIIGSTHDRLKQCYIWSFSQDSDNEYLKEHYSKNNGAILKLPSNFGFTIRSGWHATPAGSAFVLDYLSDLYDFFEGFVVYDSETKIKIARLACLTYDSIRKSAAETNYQKIIESHHFYDAVIQCIALFKEHSFRHEKEYRIGLIRKNLEKNRFVFKRENQTSFVKIRIPSPSYQSMTEIRSLN